MMRRIVSISRRKLQLSAAQLSVALMVMLLRPQTARAQAMVRDEPALHSYDDATNPSAPANGRVSREDDLTVRQTPSGSVADSGLPASSIQGNDGRVVDLRGGRGAAVLADRVKWRPIFYLNLGVAYNDNIFITEHKQGDAITTIEPGLILALGDFRDALPHMGAFEHVYQDPLEDENAPQRYIYLDYHPSIYLFAKHSSQNAVDESANLLGAYNFPKLDLGVHALYQKLSIEDVDAGYRIDRDYYTLDLTSLYHHNTKTSYEFNFGVRDHEYDAPYVSSTELVSQNYLDYAYGPKTQFAVGIEAGYVNYRHFLNQTYQQILGRVTSIQFAKFDFVASGGIEFRQNLGNDNQSRVGGVFDANLNFHPYDGTTLSLLASRETEPSALADEEVTYTRVGLSLEQRILSRVYLTARGTYENADYSNVESGQSLARTDNAEEFFISAAADITQYATAQLTYLFRNANSTLPGRTYTENVAGLLVRFTY